MNKIELGWIKDIVIVRVVGRGCFSNSRNLKEAMSDLLNGQYKEVFIDFRDCKTMDSTFIGVLTGLTLKMKKKGENNLFIANLGKSNRDLLDTLGVLRFFQVDDDERVFDTHFESVEDTPQDPDEAITMIKHILEAHETLMKADESNIGRFKNVTDTLEKELSSKLEQKNKSEGKIEPK